MMSHIELAEEDRGRTWRIRGVRLGLLAILFMGLGGFILYARSNPFIFPALPTVTALPSPLPVSLPVVVTRSPSPRPSTATPTNTATVVPTATATRLPTVTVPPILPTPAMVLDLEPISQTIRINQSQPAIQDAIRKAFGQYDGERQAGIVLTYGYVATNGDITHGGEIAQNLNKLLMQTLPGVFVKDSTIFREYHWVDASHVGEATVEVYFVTGGP